MHDQFQDITCNTASDVIEKLGRLAALCDDASRPRSASLFFRGHARSKWKLLSGFHRSLLDGTGAAAFRESVEGKCHPTVADGFEVSTWTLTARQDLIAWLLTRLWHDIAAFADLAAEVGLLHGAAASEATTIANIHRSPFPMDLAQGSPALVGLAQHHGIPTTLLDWTANPFVALWFAVREVDSTDPNETACVWGIPRSWLESRLRVRVVRLFDQEYARVQAGLFTLDTGADRDFNVEGRIPCLSEYAVAAIAPTTSVEKRTSPASSCGFRLSFPRSEANQLLLLLRDRRITTAHLMPTLKTVADTVLRDRAPSPGKA